MVDAPRLGVLLERLQSRRSRLDRYARLSQDEYLANPERVDASRHLLITAIEDALGAANHVIASEGYRIPTDYADAFRSLAEAGVVSSELVDRLRTMARLRNLLVHVYGEVDDRRVHEFLRQDVNDLDRFTEALLSGFPQLREEGA